MVLMMIVCKMSAYDLLTGERRFTSGASYVAKYQNDTIVAMDDKGEWSTVSTKIGASNLLDNDVFTLHFQVVKEKNKQIS